MFGLFSKKSPTEKAIEKLQKQHAQLLEQARDLQRKGDIKGFAVKTAEADDVMAQLAKLQA
ncbi:MAG: DUF6435 family protein [Bernardetiaceae bacterium]|jgi:hypothetical protein|nr:DUF6435 family protein [Bernardetiaceae bacterium]